MLLLILLIIPILQSNQSYELEITQGTITLTRKFNVIVNPGTVAQALPSVLKKELIIIVPMQLKQHWF
jgi:hypothetical protein